MDPAPGSRKLGFGRVFVASGWVDASVAASCSRMMDERFGCKVAVAPAPLPTVPRFACVGGCTVIPREMCARLNVLGGRVGNISVPCLWHVVNGDAELFGLPVENVPCLWHVADVADGLRPESDQLARTVKNFVSPVTFRGLCRFFDFGDPNVVA